jgi:hypothetical protein
LILGCVAVGKLGPRKPAWNLLPGRRFANFHYVSKALGPDADVEGSGVAVEVQSIKGRVLDDPHGNESTRQARHAEIYGLAETATNQVAMSVQLKASMLIQSGSDSSRDAFRKRWTRESVRQLKSPEVLPNGIKHDSTELTYRLKGAWRLRQVWLRRRRVFQPFPGVPAFHQIAEGEVAAAGLI